MMGQPPRDGAPPEGLAYRRRRLTDAARLLPMVGAFAVFLPVLWAGRDSPTPDPAGTAAGGLYVFGVWTLLILAAAALSRPLARGDGSGAGHGPDRP
ncbi:hypothetical protein [Oceaniglobus trochenteri]|uniref:hypothetical protein n=1 Tax=Oceaniglobus trochenteri TaxID=2763260 RepID=UPI001CFF705F|nr:hypothetical protein [Oceaniglobus trochenteri]